MKIRIVTDSCADIPRALAAQRGIEIVPLNVHFGETVYQDGVDIWSSKLYQLIEERGVYPKTSQPSPGDFVAVYDKLLRDDDVQIVSIHLSSGLSGTYQSAVIAKDMLGTDRIHVIDSQQASVAQGAIVLAACDLIDGGATLGEVIEFVENVKHRARVLLVVDSLEYLHRNGRIGRAASLLGTILSIKPLLTVQDGVIAPLDKVRGLKRVKKRIIQEVKEQCYSQNGRLYGFVAHGNALSVAQELFSVIGSVCPIEYLELTDVGCVIGSNIGPGAFGMGYFISQNN